MRLPSWTSRSCRHLLLLGLGVSVLLLADRSASPATAQQAPTAGVGGPFSLIQMAHTRDWPEATDVNPWDGQSDGVFTYRGIPCAGNAPVNNIASDLPTYNTRIPGSRVPASTRVHPLEFIASNGAIRGRITLTVCNLVGGATTDGIPDTERDKIFIEFEADSTRFTGEETTFEGSFRLVGGTGRYADLTGDGTIAGYFMCLDPLGCGANEGRNRDMQFVMRGTYFDPTGPD